MVHNDITLPEVRFSYAWLLNEASSVMNEKYGDGTPLQSFEFYNEVAEKYQAWWQPHNDAILEGIQEITGLGFRQNIIDVHVAPWFYAISNPMVIGVIFKTEDELINVVTHELIHRLLTDNTTYEFGFDFVAQWQSLFGSNHSHKTLVHIPVHAIMEKLYVHILKRPDLTQLDKLKVADNEEYAKAWNYVDKQGSQAIIDALITARNEYPS